MRRVVEAALPAEMAFLLRAALALQAMAVMASLPVVAPALASENAAGPASRLPAAWEATVLPLGWLENSSGVSK
jgi:hypothetical protein